jgi:hypothetical protein
MGTDASSMKDDAIIPENISNVHTTVQEESFNHMSRFIEQNQINNEMEARQDVKVEHYCYSASLLLLFFAYLSTIFFFRLNLFVVYYDWHRCIRQPVSFILFDRLISSSSSE